MKVRKSVALMNEFIHGLLDPKEAKVMIVFTFLCLGCVTSPVQAAPPVGQTIWLYHVDNGSYLAVDAGNSFQVTATGTAEINSPSELIVEDAGSGYIRFKSVLNGNYIRVNTGNVDKLIADSLDGNDPITHFIWTDLPEGKVRLTSVGDNDDANNLSPNGSAQIVRANNSGSGSVTEFLWGSLTPPPAPTGPPNIVLIYIDDWAWNGTSVPMDNRMPNSFFPSIIEMPNLNAIAANGMVFRNAYGSPQCTPARAAIQTGQSNARNGITVFMSNSGYYDNDSITAGKKYYHFPVIANGADNTLRSDATTIPEALAPFGYVSAHIGKWHLRGSPADEGYVLHDGATTNSEGNNYTNAGGLEALTDPKLMTHITDTGMTFMEEQVTAGNPFFLQLSHYAVHGGSECTPESRARYQNLPEVVAFNNGKTNPDNINRKSDPAVWLGMIYELDQKIGQIRQKLVQLGIQNNTYLIVAGDNGYRHSFYDELSGNKQPLHSRKWWAWQGGIRVPMIAEGPDILPQSYCVDNVTNYDFLPTFVEWAGGNPASIPNLDGVSLAGLMRGEEPTMAFRNRSLYFHYPHYRNTMPHSAIVKGGHKAIYFYETPVRFPDWDPIMLFDLRQDAGEYNNIYADNTALGDELYADLMNYLNLVGARIPQVPNPNYDAAIYESASEYNSRVGQGPFIGTRGTAGDEGGPQTFADYWMNSWGATIGTDADDFDGDGISNILEYALGGDPTNPDAKGRAPAITSVNGQLFYRFPKRNDDSSLIYTVEKSLNLSPGSWDTVDDDMQTDSSPDEVDDILLPIPDNENVGFFRLNVVR